MTEERPRYIPPAHGVKTPSEDRLAFANGLSWIGMGLALVMAVTGLARIAQNGPVPCSDDETGGACVVHPHALEGSVITIAAVLLGILIYLGSAILRQLDENARSTHA